jgi:hypothetical protein
VVELEQSLDMDGQAGFAIVCERIQHQPRERVVALQHISETNVNID